MLGAMCGDFVGSVHEFRPTKDVGFQLVQDGCIWTDDTAMTEAVARAIMDDHDGPDFERALAQGVRAHPMAGYGPAFRAWALSDDRERQDSWGNGAAMRVSSIPWLASSIADAERLARASAMPSHSHQHGIRGAVATAVMGRAFLEGASGEEARALVERLYGYDLSRTPDQIRPSYRFQVSCMKSVPEAMCCVLAASSWEEAVRLAVSLGGDADTQGAIAGGLAEARYGRASIPPAVVDALVDTLPDSYRATLAQFDSAVRPVSGRSSWSALERWHAADFATHPADDRGVALLKSVEDLQEKLQAPATKSWLARMLERTDPS